MVHAIAGCSSHSQYMPASQQITRIEHLHGRRWSTWIIHVVALNDLALLCSIYRYLYCSQEKNLRTRKSARTRIGYLVYWSHVDCSDGVTQWLSDYAVLTHYSLRKSLDEGNG